MLCNLTGGLTGPPDQMALEPTWSWDGQQIAFRIGDPETAVTTLHVVDLATSGPPRTLIAEPMVMSAPAWGPR
jgi:hypothetical protein